jgi:hypothetical protein
MHVVLGVFRVGVVALSSGSASRNAFHRSLDDIVAALRFFIIAKAASENRLTA